MASPRFCSVFRRFSILRLSHLHGETVPIPLYYRLHVCFLALLCGKHEGRGKRNLNIPECRVGTLHRSGPEPCYDGKLLIQKGFKIGSFLDHLRRNPDLGVEVADAFFRLIPHPLTIIANVFR